MVRPPQSFSLKRLGIMAAITLGGMALLFGVLIGFDGVGEWMFRRSPGYLRGADFGEAWPLIVDEGRVACQPGSRVTFETLDGKTYAVTGSAQDRYPEIGPIWRDDPKIAGAKVNIGPLIDAGMKLCR